MTKFLQQKKYLFFSLSGLLLVLGGVSGKKFQFFSQSSQGASENRDQQKTDFLFVASWSPAYCAERDPMGKTTQCRRTYAKKFRFIVHGLWPQGGQGMKRNYCKEVSQQLEGNIVNDYFYLMPSSTLMLHQWKKHASCGAFTQKSYFGTIEKLYQKFEINDLFADIEKTHTFQLNDLINKITTDSPMLKAENIVVRCRQNRFKEIRICLNHDFALRKCRGFEIKSGGCRKNQPITVRF